MTSEDIKKDFLNSLFRCFFPVILKGREQAFQQEYQVVYLFCNHYSIFDALRRH